MKQLKSQSFVNKVYGMKNKAMQVKIFYDFAKNTPSQNEFCYFLDQISLIVKHMTNQEIFKALEETQEKYLVQKYRETLRNRNY